MVIKGYPEVPDETNQNLEIDEVQSNYNIQNSDESDFEEGNSLAGYQPLPLVLDSAQETYLESSAHDSEIINRPSNTSDVDKEIENQIWDNPRPEELGIELDNLRTEQIINVMANVTLPSSAIPEWAQQIPEEKWKQDLLDKIREKNFNNNKSS